MPPLVRWFASRCLGPVPVADQTTWRWLRRWAALSAWCALHPHRTLAARRVRRQWDGATR